MAQLSQILIERLFQGAPRRRHHEAVHPRSDGEASVGGAIALNANASDKTNAAATTLNYWGEPHLIVMPTVITADPWYFIGSYNTLLDAASADKVFQGAWYKISVYNVAARDAGNAWNEGATVLTVDDSDFFAVDDLVWIVSTGHTNGEIQRVTDVTGAVVTVEREASQFGAANTGLRWDHTIDGTTETMYLCYRPGDPIWHATDFQFESGTTRRSTRYVWAAPRVMPPSAGLIARILNATDSVNDLGMYLKVIYNHT